MLFAKLILSVYLKNGRASGSEQTLPELILNDCGPLIKKTVWWDPDDDQEETRLQFDERDENVRPTFPTLEKCSIFWRWQKNLLVAFSWKKRDLPSANSSVGEEASSWRSRGRKCNIWFPKTSEVERAESRQGRGSWPCCPARRWTTARVGVRRLTHCQSEEGLMVWTHISVLC